jgi:hypothetical protein
MCFLHLAGEVLYATVIGLLVVPPWTIRDAACFMPPSSAGCFNMVSFAPDSFEKLTASLKAGDPPGLDCLRRNAPDLVPGRCTYSPFAFTTFTACIRSIT